MTEFELKPHLKSLLSAPGLSAFEKPVMELISTAWAPYVDELKTTPLGSLHGLKRGQKPGSKPKILLAAHMDAIGLMVTSIQDGFLRVTQIGGIDPRILVSQPVVVHGRRQIPGIIVQNHDHLIPPALREGPPVLETLLIDTGLDAKEVETLVRPGDPISFANLPVELSEDILSGHSQDNRASVAALSVCLSELSRMKHDWDVIVAATVQEEETLGGGFTSAFHTHPDMAIAVDVTFGKQPGVSDYNTFQLGKGVALGMGPNVHPAIYNALKNLCIQLDMPYFTDIMPQHSGTDAYAMQIVAEGFPTMVVGIPVRYMHTPVETVHIKDIQRTGHLLAEFISRLEVDFFEKITWDK